MVIFAPMKRYLTMLAVALLATCSKGGLQDGDLIFQTNDPGGFTDAIEQVTDGAWSHVGIIQTNHFGVVDESYCGPNDWWKMPVFAVRDTFIRKNERIAQFRIIEHQPALVFTEEKLTGTDRGGFGSTGTK